MGEMLKVADKAKGTRGQQIIKKSGGNTTLPPVDDTPTLADIGITKTESSRALTVTPDLGMMAWWTTSRQQRRYRAWRR